MSNFLVIDSVKVVNGIISETTGNISPNNWWMWIAIAEFVIIFFLLIGKLKQRETAKQKFKRESLKQNIDFDNIINSSFNSVHLYDELKVKCHPDRFPTDADKNIIAEGLFQQITKNKTNVKKLLELKEEAIQKLNIKFKN